MGFRQYGPVISPTISRILWIFVFSLQEFLPRAQALGASERAKPRDPRVANAAPLFLFLLNKLHVNERQRVTDRKGPSWMAR